MKNNRCWIEEDFTKIDKEITNYVMTNYDEFIKLHKMYKFVPIPDGFCFIDKKWKMCVAKVIKNHIINNDYDILFNKDWLRLELFRTNSETVLDFCKHNIQCTDIYQDYLEYKNKIKDVLKHSLKGGFEYELDKINSE